MKYLLGIDNGGTFSKAALFDENGEQISVASFPTETLTPKPGYTEKNLEEKGKILISEANRNGGKDNIAIVLIEPFANEVEEC